MGLGSFWEKYEGTDFSDAFTERHCSGMKGKHNARNADSQMAACQVQGQNLDAAQGQLDHAWQWFK